MINSKQKILIFADYFRPGYKAGGPIQSLVNLVAMLRKTYDVFLYNKNHDINEIEQPYDGVEYNTWIKDAELGISLYYASSSHQKILTIKKIVNRLKPDYIYLNSFFSPVATIYPLLATTLAGTNSRIVLAPRGELKQTALDIKANKKKLYMTVFRLFLKHKITTWHATNTQESKFIQKEIGVKANDIIVTPNLPIQVISPLMPVRKKEATADFVMLSRIAPIKNIDFILKVLVGINIPMSMDIYGTMEDEKYWDECQSIIKKMNPSIIVQYKGHLEPQEVLPIMSKYRFFISPTKGENFGHSIFEAFVAGLPVIISDQTPWLNLVHKGIGYDIPLCDPEKWRRVIESCINCDDVDYFEYAKNAWTFANDYRNDEQILRQYKIIFSERGV